MASQNTSFNTKRATSNKLNRRIEIWGKKEITNEIGEVDHVPVKLKTVWAQILPQTGTMGQRVGTDFAAMTHKIILRYSLSKELRTDFYFMYGSRKFEILYILNPYEANTELQVFVKEVIE